MNAQRGMTLKQAEKCRFLHLCDEYREAKEQMHTEEGRIKFIALSVQIHIAKGQVPKSYWKYANLKG